MKLVGSSFLSYMRHWAKTLETHAITHTHKTLDTHTYTPLGSLKITPTPVIPARGKLNQKKHPNLSCTGRPTMSHNKQASLASDDPSSGLF